MSTKRTAHAEPQDRRSAPAYRNLSRHQRTPTRIREEGRTGRAHPYKESSAPSAVLRALFFSTRLPPPPAEPDRHRAVRRGTREPDPPGEVDLRVGGDHPRRPELEEGDRLLPRVE